MNTADRFVRLVIPRPGIEELYYRLEGDMKAGPGSLVEIDLRNETIWAIVREVVAALPDELRDLACRPVRRVIGDTPLFHDPRETRFLQWLGDYYLYPFPKLVKQIVAPFISPRRTLPRPSAPVPPCDTPPCTAMLDDDQRRVATAIRGRWRADDRRPVLLFGVTGSGKSEVFADLCREVFDAGGQVLYLVPEVGLTPGTIAHLESRLGERAVIAHSYLSPKKRFDAFSRACRGEAKLVVGTRSALLYPLSKVGLIIVDEEHDPSYKNMEPPYYHARDAAVMKASLLDIPVILGSATPSSESWHNAERGKYHLERLPRRANRRPLPAVRIFPYRGDTYLPSELLDAVREGVARREQALFFVNRRGFSTIAVCRSCEAIQKCPRCEVALVYHKKKGRLLCHHCNFSIAPDRCAACTGTDLSLEGIGIERFTETLRGLFPGASVVSIDRDSVPDETALSTELAKIEDGTHDIVAGTVMISKGHNFPALRWVVIKHADFLLSLADYRAAERCFQVVAQVAGRAGRFDIPGEVWAEAQKPEHYLWRHLPEYDFEGFIDEELAWRRALLLPPFSRLAVVKVVASSEKGADETAKALYEELRGMTAGKKVRLLPPAAPPLQRVHNRYRRHIVLSAASLRPLAPLLADLISRHGRRRGVTVTCDMDALSTVQV
ncbi:MAG TPA: primosomal protein N' [bacterium]|nr:primosomal protein N' [bacterium]